MNNPEITNEEMGPDVSKYVEIVQGLVENQIRAGREEEDGQVFELYAEDICSVLNHENIHSSAERMPCLGTKSEFLRHSRAGDHRVSRWLAANSVTLPISNEISLDTVKTICSLVEAIQQQAADILAAKAKPGPGRVSLPAEPPDTIDIDSKFRKHFSVPVLDNSLHSTIFVPRAHLRAHNISVDELLYCFSARREWSRGDTVVADLRGDAIVSTTVILAPYDAKSAGSGGVVTLEGSRSSANVALVPGVDGRLTLRKTAVGDGIDGNGAPRLRRQALFLGASEAVKKTGMFVVLLEVDDKGNEVTVVLDYIPSHLCGELIFANVGADPAATAIVDLFARMSGHLCLDRRLRTYPSAIH